MAKAFDDYSSFKVEHVQPRSAPRRRRFKLSLLLWLVLGWALLLRGLETTGFLSTFFAPTGSTQDEH